MAGPADADVEVLRLAPEHRRDDLTRGRRRGHRPGRIELGRRSSDTAANRCVDS